LKGDAVQLGGLRGDGAAICGKHHHVNLTADLGGGGNGLGHTGVQLAVGVLRNNENLAHFKSLQCA
jgi:hypothetical protein